MTTVYIVGLLLMAKTFPFASFRKIFARFCQWQSAWPLSR